MACRGETRRSWSPGAGRALAGLAVWLCAAVAAGAAPDDPQASLRVSLEDLVLRSTAVNRAYEPFRRQTPADTAAWAGLSDLYRTLDGVAAGAEHARDLAVALRGEPGFRPAVGPTELRRRLTAVDSLTTECRSLAGQDWRRRLPADPQEARLRVGARARAAKILADRTAAAAQELAYAMGVTEGINARSLNLSFVGLIVVFAVLALIAGVVGSVRRLDDGWQREEQEHARRALQREPTIDAVTLVLIAAACATLITGRFRVRRIRRLLSPATKRTPWSSQGRLILLGSHDFGRKHG